jgi:KDO2-lipid IV(A) lauroyltransferase
MARLIFASGLDRQAKRHVWLRSLLFALESGIVHLFWWLFRALSPGQATRLAAWAVGKIGPRLEKAAMVQENLRIAFPDLDSAAIETRALRTWQNMGMVLGEYPHLEKIARPNGDRRIEIVDHCNLDLYRRRERQAIFVGAHVCNWEIMALALAREGVPLLALYAPLQNPRLGELMARARAQLGCQMLARGESMRALIKQIRGGGSIGLLLDLSVDGGIAVPFFGAPMSTSLTPARMAQRYGCDIVPVRTQRLGPARFRFTAYPKLVIDACTDADAQAFAITRSLNALMEQWIREQPEEWMCANRRWDKALHRELRQTT